MDLPGPPYPLTAEQLRLMVFHNQTFIVANSHRVGEQPLFVFGRSVSLAHLWNRSRTESDRRELVLRYTLNAAALQMAAMTYSVLAPEGALTYLSVGRCWPISRELFTKLANLGWDLTHRHAPVAELEAVIASVTQRKEGATAE